MRTQLEVQREQCRHGRSGEPHFACRRVVLLAVNQRWWTAYTAILLVAAGSAAIRPHVIALMHPAISGVADTLSLSYAFVLLAALCLVPLVAFVLMSSDVRRAVARDGNQSPAIRM